MSTEVLVSLITLIGSAIGTFAGIAVNSKLTNYRIEQLEQKVNRHNQVIERVYRIEQHNAVVDKELSVTNHRISDLEELRGGRQ